MKIDNSLKTVAPAKAKESGRGQRNALSKLLEDSGVHDEVELSGNDTKLRELENRLASLQITDSEKIETIRQAIADGTFTVDQDAVAEGMIGETLNQLRQQIKR